MKVGKLRVGGVGEYGLWPTSLKLRRPRKGVWMRNDLDSREGKKMKGYF